MSIKRPVNLIALAVASALLVPVGDADALAKQLSNPISSLISVPFQFNAAFGGGPAAAEIYVAAAVSPKICALHNIPSQ